MAKKYRYKTVFHIGNMKFVHKDIEANNEELAAFKAVLLYDSETNSVLENTEIKVYVRREHEKQKCFGIKKVLKPEYIIRDL